MKNILYSRLHIYIYIYIYMYIYANIYFFMICFPDHKQHSYVTNHSNYIFNNFFKGFQISKFS